MSPTPHRPLPPSDRRGRGRVAALLLATLLAACNSAPDKRALQYMNQEGFGKRYVGNAEEENYLSIGDGVRILDLLNPEQIKLSTTVGIDGTILLPQVGSLPVAGYTRSELEAELTRRYALYYEENDIVVDITTRSKSFWVIGEVSQPGRKTYTGDQVVLEAVLEALPLRSSANVGRIRLVRGDPRDPLVMYFNLRDLTSGDTSANYQIRENDVIVVPATLLGELGYFLEALLFPVQRVLSSLGGAFFGNNNGRNVNDNRALTLGQVF